MFFFLDEEGRSVMTDRSRWGLFGDADDRLCCYDAQGAV